jgi:hypothetical protein
MERGRPTDIGVLPRKHVGRGEPRRLRRLRHAAIMLPEGLKQQITAGQRNGRIALKMLRKVKKGVGKPNGLL